MAAGAYPPRRRVAQPRRLFRPRAQFPTCNQLPQCPSQPPTFIRHRNARNLRHRTLGTDRRQVEKSPVRKNTILGDNGSDLRLAGLFRRAQKFTKFEGRQHVQQKQLRVEREKVGVQSQESVQRLDVLATFSPKLILGLHRFPELCGDRLMGLNPQNLGAGFQFMPAARGCRLLAQLRRIHLASESPRQRVHRTVEGATGRPALEQPAREIYGNPAALRAERLHLYGASDARSPARGSAPQQ